MELWSIILFYGVNFFHWTGAEIINGQNVPITVSNLGFAGKVLNITATIDGSGLNLTNFGTYKIFCHDIDALKNITQLAASRNFFGTFPQGNCNLKSLRVLDLSYNVLTELTAAIWDSKDLTTLLLSGNFLKRLPPVTWGMRNLRVIILSRNEYHISDEESPFLQFKNLTFLDLSHNRLQKIQGKMFAGIPETAYILIGSNPIKWMGGPFSDVIELNVSSGLSTVKPKNRRSVDISQKNDLIRCDTADGMVESIRILQKNESSGNCRYFKPHLGGHVNLIVRDASGFKHGWYGKNLPHARVRLINSDLPIIDSAVTDSLSPNVSWLELISNNITTIEDGVFEKLNLKNLSLNHNNLKTIASIGNLPSSLEVLSLDGNFISEISSDSFDGLINLQELTMIGNGLKTIGMKTFDKMKNLMKLDFSANEIDRLESAWFKNLQKLEVIKFNNNRIRDIPRFLSSMTQLRELYLGGNMIHSILNERFPKSLSVLDLGSNSIQSIEPGSFTNMTIGELNLHSNGITEDIFLNNTFHETVVGSLHLHSNSITKIPEGAFKGISVLNRVNLRSNPLKIIEKGAFVGLGTLKILDLRYTDVTELRNGVLFGLSPLQNRILTTRAPLQLIQTGVYDEMRSEKTCDANCEQEQWFQTRLLWEKSLSHHGPIN